MIIKGLFKRYERWNPVHPTMGAFWGMGVGVGCGVGWGPGFGPEVIGYVGAGCGVGFSVGFTIAGAGVGLPVSTPFRFPHDDALLISADTFSSAKATATAVFKYVSGDWWNSIAVHASSFTKEASRNVSNFSDSLGQAKSVQLSEVHKIISEHAQSSLICIEEFRNQHLPPKKG